MQRIRVSSSLSPFFLREHSRFTSQNRIHGATFDMSVVRTDAEGVSLLFAELDVTDPSTDRGLRRAGPSCDLLDRCAFLDTQLPSQRSFACFHIGKLATAPDG
jgi:hypothetical protein